MDRSLLQFIRQWLAVVIASLAPVVFCAFVSIPLALGRHPGEPLAQTGTEAGVERHLT
jgi:hypothetical protein